MGNFIIQGVITGVNIISGVMAINSAGDAMFNGNNFLEGLSKAGDELVNSLYKTLDYMDGIANLYDTAQQREDIINAAINFTEGKDLDPTDLISDLGGLMLTGNFATNEEALMFDATLRELFHNNGYNDKEVDAIMPQVIAEMQMGGDLTGFVGEFIDENFYTDTDGQGGKSALDVQNYLIEQKGKIDYLFGKQTFSSEYVEYLDTKKKDIAEREISTDYNGILSLEDKIKWLSLEGVNAFGGGYEYKLDADGSPYASKETLGYSNGDIVTTTQDFGIETDIYKNAFMDHLDEMRNGYFVPMEIYRTKSYSQEEIENRREERQKNIVDGHIQQPEKYSTSNNDVMQNDTQSNTEVNSQNLDSMMELYNKEFDLFSNIDTNISEIYKLMAGDTPVSIDGEAEDEVHNVVDIGTHTSFDDFVSTYGPHFASLTLMQSDLNGLKLGVVGGGDTQSGNSSSVKLLSGLQNSEIDTQLQPIQTLLTSMNDQLILNNSIDVADLIYTSNNTNLEASNNILLQQIVTLLGNALNKPTNVTINNTIERTADVNYLMSELSRILGGTVKITPGVLT